MNKKIQAAVHIFLSELFRSELLLGLLGWAARVIYGERMSTIALFYPANRRYIQSVSFDWYARRVKWRPSFGGIFVTSRGCGLIFAIGALEEEFSDPANIDRLMNVHESMERIARKLHIPSVAYSGVLPSVLARAGVSREPIEVVRTAAWIVEAVDAVRDKFDMSPSTPIVVLGAAGYLGQRVVQLLKNRGIEQVVVEIDPAHHDSRCHGQEILTTLVGSPLLMINISRSGVMEQYASLLWKGVVVLNEVYPECTPECLGVLKRNGVSYFHIQGVHAWSIPKFPGAYRGAVPCCAASAANADGDALTYKAKLKLLEK